MEIILIVLIVSMSNLICFFIACRLAQKLLTNQSIEGPKMKIPTLNPIKIHSNKVAQHQQAEELRKSSIIMQNIENYDGTGANQKDVE